MMRQWHRVLDVGRRFSRLGLSGLLRALNVPSLRKRSSATNEAAVSPAVEL